jgi:outer membrane lipoprotein-sorting protein
MSMFSSRPALRWLVPTAAAVAVIGGGAAIGTFAASAEPSLPPRSAAQLLVDVQTARLDAMSGTVVQRADLGLPDLPALPAVGGAEEAAVLSSLLAGSNTMRVWYAGPDQARLALQDTLGEVDFIRDGRDLWVWQSKSNTATHRKLPAEADGKRLPPEAALPVTPQQAADQALAAIDPTTEVTIGTNGRVAGRTAYELVLAPRDKASLVGQVRIAIDSKEYIPLRFEIFPKGSDAAAFSVAFTQISFERPAVEKFRFNPPPGAKVTEKSADDAVGHQDKTKPRDLPRKPPAGEKPDSEPAKASTAVIGEGWTTVFAARVSDSSPEADIRKEDGQEAAAVLEILGSLQRVNGAWGSGRLLPGKLLSVLLTDDGRLLLGAVAPERLYQVAADPAAAFK